jgi:hypothetical protein
MGAVKRLRTRHQRKAGIAAGNNPRIAQPMIERVELQRRQMQNANLVSGDGARVILITFQVEAAGESILFVRHKSP